MKANFDRLKPIAEIVKKTGTKFFNFLAFQNPSRALKLLREDVFLEPLSPKFVKIFGTPCHIYESVS